MQALLARPSLQAHRVHFLCRVLKTPESAAMEREPCELRLLLMPSWRSGGNVCASSSCCCDRSAHDCTNDCLHSASRTKGLCQLAHCPYLQTHKLFFVKCFLRNPEGRGQSSRSWNDHLELCCCLEFFFLENRF